MYRAQRVPTMDIYQMLQYARTGKSNRYIADNTQCDRRTVGTYKRFFKKEGLLDGELVSVEALHERVAAHFDHKRKGRRSKAEAWDGQIRALLAAGLSPRLIHQKLSAEEAEFAMSESAIYRYVARIAAKAPSVTIRVETPSGEEAQVDFGKGGLLWDEQRRQLRSSWLFVMVLSWSRHMYVEFVFDQRVTTWLSCHRRAFEFFGGVPQRLKIDNLKAGIVKACFEDPQVQRAYGECAQHYGFRIDPCRPRTPQHKGKVERGGVAYVKGSFVPLLAEGCTLAAANQQVRSWLLATAGQRKHGTTQVAPLTRFETEGTMLQPLPVTPFEAGEWKTVKLARDCHVTFDKSRYSAPFRYVGQKLQLRATGERIELYDDNWTLIAIHSRSVEAGSFITLTDHLPAEKVAGLLRAREVLQAEAEAVGPNTATAVAQLLAERPLERRQMVQRILSLKQRYGAARLEAACERGLFFDDVHYRTLKRILQRQLDGQQPPQFPTADGGTLVYARSQEEFVAAFCALAQGGEL